MNAYKKIIIKIGLSTLAVLLIFTLASNSINNMLLPVATGVVITPDRLSGTIEKKTSASGVFKAEDEGEQDSGNIIAGDNWIIKTIHVKKGDAVKKGDKIFTLDIKESQIRLKQMESSLQEMKNRVNSADLSGGDMLVLRQQLDIKQMEYDQANASFPHSGIIKAPQDGIINELSPLGNVMRGAMLCVFNTEKAQNSLQFDVPISLAKTILDSKAILSAEFTIIDTQTLVKIEECSENITITKAAYQDKTGMYTIYASLNTDKIIPTGTPAKIICESKSEAYPLIIPLSCVFTDEKGETYALSIKEQEGIFGISFYVEQIAIDILESDYRNAAVKINERSSFQMLASYPSKPIKDGETIRVVGKNA